MTRFTLILLLILCARSIAAQKGCPAALEDLARGQMLEQSTLAFKNQERLAVLKEKLKPLRETRAFMENYLAEGKIFGYPNHYIVLTAMWVTRKQWAYPKPIGEIRSGEIGRYQMQGLLDGLAFLRTQFSASLLEPPKSAEEMGSRSAEIANRIEAFNGYFKDFLGGTNWSDWMTQKKFLEFAQLLKNYDEQAPEISQIPWETKIQQYNNSTVLRSWFGSFQLYDHFDRVWKSGLMPRLHVIEPSPSAVFTDKNTKGFFSYFKRMDAETTIYSAMQPQVEKLQRVSRSILEIENEISKLSGNKPEKKKDTPLLAYIPQTKTKDNKAGGDDVHKSAVELLQYREALIATYLNGSGVIGEAPIQRLLKENDLKALIALFDFAPQPRDLFEDHLRKLNLTEEAFHAYASELSHLKDDPRIVEELQKLLKDREQGYRDFKAFQTMVGQTAPSQPRYLPAIGKTQSIEARTANPAFDLPRPSFFKETTGLALAISKRGELAQGAAVLKPLAEVSARLKKNVGKGKISKVDALEAFLPALEHSQVEVRKLANDFALIDTDVKALKGQISSGLDRALAQAKTHLETKNTDTRELELLDREIDELKTRSRNVDTLDLSVQAYRASLVAYRKFLVTFESALTTGKPGAAHELDVRGLMPLFTELAALVKK